VGLCVGDSVHRYVPEVKALPTARSWIRVRTGQNSLPLDSVRERRKQLDDFW
jgi:hypothetical protein